MIGQYNPADFDNILERNSLILKIKLEININPQTTIDYFKNLALNQIRGA